MIERYTLTSLDDIADQFGAAPPSMPPRFNIAPLQISLIVTADGIQRARWGLLPPWRGHGGKRDAHILNAAIEILDAKPITRNAFQRQRCLILADGFFAWQQLERKTQPLWIHPAPHRDARSHTVTFAAIAATHRDDRQLSFAFLISALVPVAAQFAPVSPLVIAPDDRAAWLTGPRDRATALLANPSSLMTLAGWRAEPISSYVNSPDHDEPRCIEPLRNPLQGELF